MNEESLQIVQLRVVKKRSGQRLVVELEGCDDLELDPEIVVQNRLKSGGTLSSDCVESLRREDAVLQAHRRLTRYLALRVKSVAEARRYLEKAGFEGAVIDLAVDRARKRDLLDDRRFAECFVRTRLKSGIYGPLRLLADLKSHGIESSLAEEVLQPQFDLDWQLEAAAELAAKRAGRSSTGNPDKEKKRLFDFLVRRGFQAEIAREVVGGER